MRIRKHESTRDLKPLPFDERIKQRAFEIYERRRGFPGSPLIDWLRAEWECRLEEAGNAVAR
jgi:hypothetical protein